MPETSGKTRIFRCFSGAEFNFQNAKRSKNMASITPKPNGTYLIRISCGTDAAGKPVTKSRVFKPSKPKLTYLPKGRAETEMRGISHRLRSNDTQRSCARS